MPETRHDFDEGLAQLEEDTVDVGERAERMVGMAVRAVVESDVGLADEVVTMDDQLDRDYQDIHERWIHLMARQNPMAADLRLMSALLHLNVTLERMGDQAVNISKITKVVAGLPRVDRIVGQIDEMGELVVPMVRTALQAFVRRDVDEARLLPGMDDPIDRLNRNMYREVVACGGDERLLEWATRMMMVSRAIERIGDQAVDIGEQTVFVVTGEILEFDGKGINDGGTAAG